MTTAAHAQANGWGAGTYLIGDDGYGSDVIELLSAVYDTDGTSTCLARYVSHNGKRTTGKDIRSWTLDERDWQATTPPDTVPQWWHDQQQAIAAGRSGGVVASPAVAAGAGMNLAAEMVDETLGGFKSTSKDSTATVRALRYSLVKALQHRAGRLATGKEDVRPLLDAAAAGREDQP